MRDICIEQPTDFQWSGADSDICQRAQWGPEKHNKETPQLGDVNRPPGLSNDISAFNFVPFFLIFFFVDIVSQVCRGLLPVSL